MYGEKENAARTRNSLWWPLAQWALHHTNTSHPQHGDSPTRLLTRCPNTTSHDGVTPSVENLLQQNFCLKDLAKVLFR